jgi:hypothetical protein
MFTPYKTLHRKQTYKQGSTKHYTENKHTNSDLQNITQKTKSMNSTNSTEIEDELGRSLFVCLFFV